eukprot:1134280-Rhodomonas_salina.1
MEENMDFHRHTRGLSDFHTFSSEVDGRDRINKRKFEKPDNITHKYREEYNILNTIIQFEHYMMNHEITMERWPAYAVSYFDDIIQTWYNGRYPGDTPDWATLRGDLIRRYLEPDHDLRVRLRFESTIQNSTLMDYVERFQRILAAMVFAGVQRPENEVVLQFIRGLKKEKDHHTILQKDCTTMEEVYTAVQKIRQSKALAAQTRGGRRSNSQRKYSKELRKLT